MKAFLFFYIFSSHLWFAILQNSLSFLAVHGRIYCSFKICECHSYTTFSSQSWCWLAGTLSLSQYISLALRRASFKLIMNTLYMFLGSSGNKHFAGWLVGCSKWIHCFSVINLICWKNKINDCWIRVHNSIAINH